MEVAEGARANPVDGVSLAQALRGRGGRNYSTTSPSNSSGASELGVGSSVCGAPPPVASGLVPMSPGPRLVMRRGRAGREVVRDDRPVVRPELVLLRPPRADCAFCERARALADLDFPLRAVVCRAVVRPRRLVLDLLDGMGCSCGRRAIG